MLQRDLCSISPTAFVSALILAPMVVTGLTFWTLIGLFALFFGAIPYLLIGTPVLLWAVSRITPDFWRYAALGFVANLLPLAGLMLISWIKADVHQTMDQLVFIFGFGLIFGPLWAGTFAALYRRFHPNRRILKL